MTCPPDHPHNLTCYSSHRCRCDTCRHANTTYAKQWRARKHTRIPHGYGGYTNYGCRCPHCTQAMTTKRAEQRAWKRLQDGKL